MFDQFDLIFWSLFHVISIPFCPKIHLGPKLIKKEQFVFSFGKTDKFPNTFYSSGTLLPSCVNRRY